MYTVIISTNVLAAVHVLADIMYQNIGLVYGQVHELYSSTPSNEELWHEGLWSQES